MKKFLQKLVILTMLLTALGPTSEVIWPTNTIAQASKRRVVKHKKKRTVHRKKRHNRVHMAWANVFIDIPKTSSDYQVAKEAVNAWNATRAVKFKLVNKFKLAFIRIRHGNYGNTGWAGLEQYRKIGKKRMLSEIKLNDFFMDEVDHDVQLAVAEHELGHSLGLEHNDKVPSVMTSVIDPDHPIHIQAVDVAKVKQIYHEK